VVQVIKKTKQTNEQEIGIGLAMQLGKNDE